MRLLSNGRRVRRNTCHGYRILGLMLLCAPVVLAPSCRGEKMPTRNADIAKNIVGKWRSPPQGWHMGEWGASQFVMELKPSQEIKVKWTVKRDSPAGGGVQSDEGTYRIAHHTLTTDVIARGEPIKVEFKDNHLILTLPQEAPDKPTEVYEFVRDEEDGKPPAD